MRGLFLVILSLTSFANARVELKYSSLMPPDQVSRIEADLHFLTNLTLQDDQQQNAKKMFNTGADYFSSREIEQWLAQRAQLIITSEDKIDKSTVSVLASDVPFPNRELPDGFADMNFLAVLEHGLQSTGSTVMQNLSSFLYLGAKSISSLIEISINGVGGTKILSPQSGIFIVGKRFFSLLDPRLSKESIDNSAHRVFRLSTLIHESRHGDGHKKQLGFPHAICPRNHPYRGVPACDQMLNGAYGVDAEFIKATLNGNKISDEIEKALMQMLYIDSKSRILSKEVWDEGIESL